VTQWSNHEATAVSDVIFVLLEDDGSVIQAAGRYRDSLRRHDGAWRFQHRAASFVTQHPSDEHAR
jgi:hypothetical protein